MLYVELAKFEIKHLHDFLEVIVARFDNFLGLLQPDFHDVVIVCVKVERNDEELAFVHGHFYDALNVMTTYHAKVAPEHFAIFIQ